MARGVEAAALRVAALGLGHAVPVMHAVVRRCRLMRRMVGARRIVGPPETRTKREQSAHEHRGEHPTQATEATQDHSGKIAQATA